MILAAFGLLVATFLAVRILDERAQKWVRVLLLVGMVICWLLKLNAWVVVQAVLLLLFLLGQLASKRDRVRAVLVLLAIWTGFGWLAGLVFVAVAMPFGLVLDAVDIQLPQSILDVGTTLLTFGSLSAAWLIAGTRALRGARNAVDVLRGRPPSTGVQE